MIKTQKKYLLILSIFAIAFISSIVVYYENIKEEIIQDEINILEDISQKYKDHINRWLNDKKTDSKQMITIPSVSKNIRLLFKDDKLNKPNIKELLSIFKALKHHLEFRRVMLLNTKFESVLSTSSIIQTYQDEIEQFKKISDLTKPYFSKIHLQDKTKELEIDLFLPIFDGKGKKKKLLGFFIAELDPHEILDTSIINYHNFKNKTGEFIVTFKEGIENGEIVVLNELRHKMNKPLRSSFKPTTSGISFYKFLINDINYYMGKDYRKKEVIAVKNYMPGLNWNITAKVDQDEVLADLRYRTKTIAGLFLSLFVAVSFVLSSISRKRKAEFYKEKLELETKKRKTEKDLIENERRLRESQKVAKLASWSRDLSTGNLYCSDEFYILLGYSKERIETSFEKFLSFLTPEDAEKLVKKNEESKKAGGKPFEMDIRYYNSKKELKYGLMRVGYEKNYRGEIIKVSGTFQDITERKLSEQKIQEMEEQFRVLYETANNAIIILNVSGDIILWNNAAEKIFGYSTKEAIGNNVHNLITPERYIDAAKNGFNNFRQTGEGKLLNKTTELKAKRKDGSELPITLSLSHFKIQDKVFITGIIEDITERKESEALILLQSTAMQASGNAIIISNEKRETDWVNRAFTKMTGYNLKEVTGKKLGKFLDADTNNNDLYISIGDKINNGEVWEGEIVNKTKEGVLLYTKTTISPFFDETSGEKKFITIKENITERHLANELLKRNEEKYRKFFEDDISGNIISKPDGTIVECNPAFVKIMGFNSKEEALSSNAYNFYKNKSDRENFLVELTKNKHLEYQESEFINSKGELITVIQNAIGIFDDEGNLEKIQTYLVDITELKKIQKDLIEAKEKAEQSNKFKSDFLAQMSHEIRTPMNAILNSADIIKMETEEYVDEDVKQFYSIIDFASRRIIRTIDLILNMSELQSGTYEPEFAKIDLSKNILPDIYNEHKHFADNKGIEFIKTIKTENCVINADSYSIGQIMANLFSNAIKYTPRGKVECIIDRNKKDELTIKVSDTGIGIEEEFLPKLFEAFTQEDQGYSREFEGNGLGLALVKEYCKINNADIKVKSKKGKGTTFTIIFHNIQYRATNK